MSLIKALAQGIERAGADVAVHDAQGTDHKTDQITPFRGLIFHIVPTIPQPNPGETTGRFVLGAPSKPRQRVLTNSPSKLPTRLADGLGLESGLNAQLPDVLRPVPFPGIRFPRLRPQEGSRS